MYSSVLQGIVTDPVHMSIPVDDHVVHRGDGIFETLKCMNGSIYNLEAHLARLRRSAQRIALVPPCTDQEITDIMIQTIRAGEHTDAYIRLLISRGPGSLGVNPYDSINPQLYIMASQLKPSFMQSHPQGARTIFSSIPAKTSFMATMKNCNYLQNVLMKKEAVDQGIDFVIALDERGYLTESATENIVVLLPDGILATPERHNILEGTTMVRVLTLARSLIPKGQLKKLVEQDISKNEMLSAPEVLIVGTTPDVTSVIELEGQAIGDGTPGPIACKLSKMLQDDMHHNPAMRTETG